MNRYYFEIPNSNVFGLFMAKSKLDAQHQLMNSQFAPFYGRVRWLTSDDDYKASTNSQDRRDSKVAVLYPRSMSKSST